MVGQNALFLFKKKYEFCNNVKNHILFPDLSIILINNFVSFNRKVYSELDRTTSLIMVNWAFWPLYYIYQKTLTWYYLYLESLLSDQSLMYEYIKSQ